MHAHEVHTDVPLVLGLLEAQFPDWASLPLERLQTAGTVNALYRLGTDLLVRLPRTDWGIGAVEREIRWLPRLAPRLPVRVPVPLAKGMPAGDYPYEWGVYPWLEGDNPTVGAISDPRSLATPDLLRSGISSGSGTGPGRDVRPRTTLDRRPGPRSPRPDRPDRAVRPARAGRHSPAGRSMLPPPTAHRLSE